MGKILCFIYDDMADFEMTLPGTVISWIKKEFVTIAYENKVVKSRPGFQYLPHAIVKEALEFEDVDGLIIPGGWGDDQKPELTELIQKLNKDNKMIAAICAGPKFLARAGILNDKKYTTTLTAEHLESQGIEDFFPREKLVSENVVRDKNVVTAVGRAFIDFSIEILDYFEAFEGPEKNAEKETFAKHYKGL